MLLFEPLLCCLGRMFWVIVMLEDPSMIHFQCSHSPKISRYIAPFILPSIRWSHPVPLAEIHSQSIRFPPPCFTVFLGLYSAFLFLQTKRGKLMPNSSILVSSDHITFSQASSGSSRCSLANFRWACTCAFYSRDIKCYLFLFTQILSVPILLLIKKLGGLIPERYVLSSLTHLVENIRE